MYRTKTIFSVPNAGILALATFILAGGAGRAMADPAAPSGAPDDARIVQRVLSLNHAEERTADAVKGKLSSLSAWQLAQRMTVGHTALDRTFGGLAMQGQAQTADGDALPDLAKLSGRDLDEAYVGHEVKSHEDMLAALDRELIPNATSEQLQARLLALRVEVAAHLRTARDVQQAEQQAYAYAQQRADIMKEVGVIESTGP